MSVAIAVVVATAVIANTVATIVAVVVAVKIMIALAMAVPWLWLQLSPLQTWQQQHRPRVSVIAKTRAIGRDNQDLKKVGEITKSLAGRGRTGLSTKFFGRWAKLPRP